MEQEIDLKEIEQKTFRDGSDIHPPLFTHPGCHVGPSGDSVWPFAYRYEETIHVPANRLCQNYP